MTIFVSSPEQNATESSKLDSFGYIYELAPFSANFENITGRHF